VFGLGLALSLGVLAFLAYEATRRDDEPPSLTVELGAPEPRGGAFQVPVTVTNQGARTAAGALIMVEAIWGSETETAEVELEWVPGRASRQAWVVFARDPSTADEVQAKVAGFESP
jgi:uncharacterized protein (TIGR02588 family)